MSRNAGCMVGSARKAGRQAGACAAHDPVGHTAQLCAGTRAPTSGSDLRGGAREGSYTSAQGFLLPAPSDGAVGKRGAVVVVVVVGGWVCVGWGGGGLVTCCCCCCFTARGGGGARSETEHAVQLCRVARRSLSAPLSFPGQALARALPRIRSAQTMPPIVPPVMPCRRGRGAEGVGGGPVGGGARRASRLLPCC